MRSPCGTRNAAPCGSGGGHEAGRHWTKALSLGKPKIGPSRGFGSRLGGALARAGANGKPLKSNSFSFRVTSLRKNGVTSSSL